MKICLRNCKFYAFMVNITARKRVDLVWPACSITKKKYFDTYSTDVFQQLQRFNHNICISKRCGHVFILWCEPNLSEIYVWKAVIPSPLPLPTLSCMSHFNWAFQMILVCCSSSGPRVSSNCNCADVPESYITNFYK